MLKIRAIIIKNKKPRRIELQHDVQLVGVDENVKYVKFNEDVEGHIESNIFHHSFANLDSLYTEWKNTISFF